VSRALATVRGPQPGRPWPPIPCTAVGAEITQLVVRRLTLSGVMLTGSKEPADGVVPIQVAATSSINMEDEPTR
jgi:hypothetical protein